MLGQIKPHFLYNVLATIDILCGIDSEKARSAVRKFAKYLRYNMNSIDIDHNIIFKDELEHINIYIDIEKIRFQSKVNVIYDIAVDNFYVPALSIEPIVENAVKHGITKKLEGGTITIRSYEKDNFFVIEISDNGVGFDVNQEYKQQSLGLKNVINRLKNCMKANIDIYSKIGVGTDIIIKLPKKYNSYRREVI